MRQIADLILAASLGDKLLTERLGSGYYRGICLTPDEITALCTGGKVAGNRFKAWAEECIGPGLNVERMTDLASSLFEGTGREEEEDNAALVEANTALIDAYVEKMAAGPISKLVEAAGEVEAWQKRLPEVRVKLEPTETRMEE